MFKRKWSPTAQDTVRVISNNNDGLVVGNKIASHYDYYNGHIKPTTSVLQITADSPLYSRKNAYNGDPIIIGHNPHGVAGYEAVGRLQKTGDKLTSYDRGHNIPSVHGGNASNTTANLTAQNSLFNQGEPLDPNDRYGLQKYLSKRVHENAVFGKIGDKSLGVDDTLYLSTSVFDSHNKAKPEFVDYGGKYLYKPDSINTSLFLRRDGVDSMLYNHTVPTDGTLEASDNEANGYRNSVSSRVRTLIDKLRK